MNITFTRILELIDNSNVRISLHGYDELAEDGILIKDIMTSVKNGVILEDYPDFPKGPCMLVLQKDLNNRPIHVVWGIPINENGPAVLITAYRPDSKQWSDDFRKRLT